MAIVIDNGACFTKIWSPTLKKPSILQNSISFNPEFPNKNFISNAFFNEIEKSELRFSRPFHKGLIFDWEQQKIIFDSIFSNKEISADLNSIPFIITEPIANFHKSRKNLVEFFFEDYNINNLYVTTSPQLSYYKFFEKQLFESNICLIVDSGFSFTHIVPIINGKIETSGLLRIDVGGKKISNYLNEIISFNFINLTNVPLIADALKENACYVSQDFNEEVKLNHKVNFLLPDFINIPHGLFLKDEGVSPGVEGMVLRLGYERITAPEILFNPSLIGIEQMGISEAIVESIESVPDVYKPHMASNIFLLGGNCHFRYFDERIVQDIKPKICDLYDVCVHKNENPILNAILGGKSISTFLTENDYINKQFYLENGSDRVSEYFYDKNYQTSCDVDLKYF